MAPPRLDGNRTAAIAGAVAALVFVGGIALVVSLTGGDDPVVAADATATSSTATSTADTSSADTSSTVTSNAVQSDDEPTVDTTATTAATPVTSSAEEPASLPAVLDGVTVRVNEEIKFSPGGTSATVAGAVILGERDVYRIGAREGQTLELSIVSLEDNAVFDVLDPNGSTIEAEVMASESELFITGDYLVVVGGTRGNATYELAVSIPA